MAYQVYYPSGCDTEVGEYFCSDCPTLEGGRVRGIAYIKNSFVFTDPTDPTEWQTGIQNKDIIIIPSVRGNFDGGSEVEGAGYGDQQTNLLGYNFVLNYFDPNYKENATFYNALKRSRNYYMAYRTETQVHFTDRTVSVVPKNPVAEDTTSVVEWNVAVKWANEDLPTPYDTPEGIFTCFDYTGVIT